MNRPVYKTIFDKDGKNIYELNEFTLNIQKEYEDFVPLDDFDESFEKKHRVAATIGLMFDLYDSQFFPMGGASMLEFSKLSIMLVEKCK